MNKLLFLTLITLMVSCKKESNTPLKSMSSFNQEQLVLGRNAKTDAPHGVLTLAQEEAIDLKEYNAVKSIKLGSSSTVSKTELTDPGDPVSGFVYEVDYSFDNQWPFPNYTVELFFNLTYTIGAGYAITNASYKVENYGSYMAGTLVVDYTNSYFTVNHTTNTIIFSINTSQVTPFPIFGGTNTSTLLMNFNGWTNITSNRGIGTNQCNQQAKGNKNGI